MGQKVNPYGFRLGVTTDWKSRWFKERGYQELVIEDWKIRDYLNRQLETAAVSRIEIERSQGRVRIDIHTARPGIVIGRKGAEIEKLREELSKVTGKDIYIDIQEVKNADLDAQLVAENVALQLERRISFRRAMKKSLQLAMDMGAKGIKIRCAGRLGGAELARFETYHQGSVPLHTLRANVEFGFAEAKTVYGKLGVKCWICKGESKRGESRVPKRTDAPVAAKVG